jgi:hypothetical protein
VFLNKLTKKKQKDFFLAILQTQPLESEAQTDAEDTTTLHVMPWDPLYMLSLGISIVMFIEKDCLKNQRLESEVFYLVIFTAGDKKVGTKFSLRRCHSPTFEVPKIYLRLPR